jgi:hypothetical protein
MAYSILLINYIHTPHTTKHFHIQCHLTTFWPQIPELCMVFYPQNNSMEQSGSAEVRIR